jgi:hypothetical protein
MKNKIIITIAAASFIAGTGCSSTWKSPSITLGGAANKDAVLDAHLNKKGVGVTAPLISVDVPFPTAKADKD